MSQISLSLSLSLFLSLSLSLSLSGLKGCSLYVKSKSTVTVSESVSESVTRSPIELFWTAKKLNRTYTTDFISKTYLSYFGSQCSFLDALASLRAHWGSELSGFF